MAATLVKLSANIVPIGTKITGGSVTSVGLIVPGDFSVSGSPITTAGSITINQPVNFVKVDGTRPLTAGWTAGNFSITSANSVAYVNVATKASGGVGTLGSPWIGWDSAITWVANVFYYFPAGFYSAASSPAGWAIDGIILCGEGPYATVLKFTGAGDAFTIQNPTYVNNMHVKVCDMALLGVAGNTNGFHFKNLHRSTFRNLRAYGALSAAGFLFEGGTGGIAENLTSSTIDGGWTSAAVNGIKLDQSGAGQPITAMTFINPRVDNMTGSGILLTSATFNHFAGGFAEFCNRGIETTATTCWANVFDGMDTESNTTDGYLLAGFDNMILGGQSIDILHVPSGANNNTVIGGLHNKITLDAGSLQTTLVGFSYNSNAGNLTDNGTMTRRINLRDQTSGANIADRVFGGAEFHATDITLGNGDNNDFALPDGSYFRIIGPSGAFALTGMTGFYDGRRVTLVNTTAQTFTVKYDITSTAANRFYNAGGANLTVGASLTAVTVVYDSLYSRWLVVSNH